MTKSNHRLLVSPANVPLAGLASVVVVIVSLGTAQAGVVGGKLELPAAPERPALQSRGYLDRVDNAYLPIVDVDPTPEMVVVLEGGPSDGTQAPAEIVWELRGDSFSQPLLPIAAGSSVVLRNTSPRPVNVTTVEDETLLKNAVINPRSSKAFRVPAAGKILTVIDTQRSHVRGVVVSMASRYFAVPSTGGAFEIADVPPGKWTVRVWYRTGFLDRIDDVITVGTARTDVKPKIPAGFPIKGGATAAASK